MHVRVILLFILLVAGSMTSACSSTPDVSGPTGVGTGDAGRAGNNPPPPQHGSCDATKAQWAIGQRASKDLLERARVAAQASVARFLRPNEIITMEYLGSRLNLDLNERDVVRAVTCG